MKYLDEFRDPVLARRLVGEIRRSATRRWTLMEVCGGQTHSLLRHGIDEELSDCVTLIHGPGCPVCVTPSESIDFAQRLCQRPRVCLTSFGDMLRVPGGRGSLLDCRSAGGNVRTVYGPVDAVKMAEQNRDIHFVFFAVGFETTAPATAIAVKRAEQLGLDNFSLLVAHVRVLPAMHRLAAAADRRVEAFLAAGHVCTVTGIDHYDDFANRYRMPVVVTGFEPVDLLCGIGECVRQLESGQAEVVNAYSRTARAAGNPTAQRIVDEVYEVCDSPWRGLGVIPGGGLRLKNAYRRFDAVIRFSDTESASLPIIKPSQERSACRGGEVLTGLIKPTQCEAFGDSCHPDSPLGAPMVSSEGACAAYYRYGMHTKRAT
jgi:hydrogenase expression/formation protein HypD